MTSLTSGGGCGKRCALVSPPKPTQLDTDTFAILFSPTSRYSERGAGEKAAPGLPQRPPHGPQTIGHGQVCPVRSPGTPELRMLARAWPERTPGRGLVGQSKGRAGDIVAKENVAAPPRAVPESPVGVGARVAPASGAIRTRPKV